VTAVKGVAVEPVPIEDADVLLADEWRNRPEYQRLVNVLGSRLTREPDASREALEKLINVRPLTYDIREVRYNPIARFLTGAVISEKVLGSFIVH
jgi:hypothetical protein